MILNNFLSDTDLPSAILPVATTVTSVPDPGFKLYFPFPPAGDKPGAEAVTALSGIPANEIVIGFGNPRYTTFILSAEILAVLGRGTTT